MGRIPFLFLVPALCMGIHCTYDLSEITRKQFLETINGAGVFWSGPGRPGAMDNEREDIKMCMHSFECSTFRCPVHLVNLYLLV